jgi:YggT family protein
MITIYIWIIIIGAVLSFLPIDPRHPMIEIVHRLTLPAFQFIRQKFPWVVISGIDLSPLLLIVGLNLIDGIMLYGPIYALLQAVHTIIFTYIILILISAVLSFIQIDPYNPIVLSINRLTQPTFQFVRQKLPFLVVGGIDLSPIVIIVALQLLDGLVSRMLIGM